MMTDRKTYKGDIELCWCAVAENVSPELEAIVVKDIRENLGDLKTPADLLFHIVEIGSFMEDGPSILVQGQKDDHRFHCKYADHFQGMKFTKEDHPEVWANLEKYLPKTDDD